MILKKYHKNNLQNLSASFIYVFKVLSLTALVLLSSHAPAQNPTRQVLFTLANNEMIVYNEYFVESLFNENKFALVIKNVETREHTFIFNGKRIATTNYDYIDIPYLEPINENGYAIAYYKEEDGKENFYVNIKGVTEGPFEDGSLFSENGYAYKLAGKWYEKIGNEVTGPYTGNAPHIGNNGKVNPDGKYAFTYYDDGDSYANINGKAFGPYEEVKSPVVLENEEYEKYAFSYKQGEEHYFNYNGKIYGPYSWYPSVVYSKNGRFAFAYEESRNEYLNIEGKIFGPYEETWEETAICITSTGKFAFVFKEDGKMYANIDDRIFGPYESAEYATVAELGEYAFCYKLEGKWHFNLNGKIITHSADYYINVMLGENNEYAVEYKKGDKYYLEVNGTTHGPYDNIWETTIEEDGNYTFFYEINGLDFKYLYGKKILLRETPKTANRFYAPPKTEKISPDKRHTFYSDYKHEYVLIDGKRTGHAPAIHVWYNDEKNSFIWNAIERNKLVVYEYKLGK